MMFGHNEKHPMTFKVPCCSGRRLLQRGVLICSVCDGPAILQTAEMRCERVPLGVEHITLKPPTVS